MAVTSRALEPDERLDERTIREFGIDGLSQLGVVTSTAEYPIDQSVVAVLVEQALLAEGARRRAAEDHLLAEADMAAGFETLDRR